MQDEPVLLQKARNLDPKALIAIFDRYAPEVYRYISYLSHDEEESDCVVGDTFHVLLQEFSCGKGPEINLRSSIFRIAYRQLMDHALHIRHVMDLEAIIEVSLGKRAVPVKTQFDEAALLQKLLSAINHDLTELQRHILLLRFVEGFSLRETAVILGNQVDHVKTMQKSGIRRLRMSLNL